MITSFKGDHDFLSNFYEHPFQLPNLAHWFNTAEHAFQCSKATSVFDYQKILQAKTPYHAKQLGRAIPLVEGWDARRREIMLNVIMAKFAVGSGTTLDKMLIATGPAVLVEGNRWNDVYWGAVPATWGITNQHGPGAPAGMPPLWKPEGVEDPEQWWVGYNWLGRLLMMWREVIHP